MTRGKEEIKEKAGKNVKRIKGMQFMVTDQNNSRPFAHELLEASPKDPSPTPSKSTGTSKVSSAKPIPPPTLQSVLCALRSAAMRPSPVNTVLCYQKKEYIGKGENTSLSYSATFWKETEVTGSQPVEL